MNLKKELIILGAGLSSVIAIKAFLTLVLGLSFSLEIIPNVIAFCFSFFLLIYGLCLKPKINPEDQQNKQAPLGKKMIKKINKMDFIKRMKVIDCLPLRSVIEIVLDSTTKEDNAILLLGWSASKRNLSFHKEIIETTISIRSRI